jgi:mono/diheme cytochrome c family protein
MTPRIRPGAPRLRALALGLGVAVVVAAAAAALVPGALRARADNRIWRGMRLARVSGCLACHAAPFNLEMANPGSPFGTVPAFAGGNLQMYVAGPQEVVEWIRDGFPASRRRDPQAWAAYQRQLIHMPAFGERLADDQIAALAAWVIAADGYLSPPDEPAQRGEEIARRQCLGCHNVGGAGGLANAGSPFGYVPGLWGPDFHDLVRDEGELRQWIATGESERVARWPLVSWFWRRQRIRMPAFGDHLSEQDVDDLVAYLAWLGSTEGGTRAAGEGARP